MTNNQKLHDDEKIEVGDLVAYDIEKLNLKVNIRAHKQRIFHKKLGEAGPFIVLEYVPWDKDGSTIAVFGNTNVEGLELENMFYEHVQFFKVLARAKK